MFELVKEVEAEREKEREWQEDTQNNGRTGKIISDYHRE